MRVLPGKDFATEAAPQDGGGSGREASAPQRQLSQQQLFDSFDSCIGRHAAVGLELFVQQNDVILIKSFIRVG